MRILLLPTLCLLLATRVCGQTLDDAKTELFNANDTVAREMFLELLKTDEKNSLEINYHLGVLHSYLRENQTAELYLKKVADAAPHSPIAYVAAGRIALINGDTLDARANFNEALSLPDKNQAFIYLEVGSAYDEFTPFYTEAIKILKTALLHDSSNALSMLMLASAYAQLGDKTDNALSLAEGVELLEKTRRMNNKLTVTYTREGGDLIQLSDFDAAELRSENNKVLTKILKALNNNQLQHEELTSLLALPDSAIKNMFLDSAIVFLKKATASNVKLANAWLLLGNALYKRSHEGTPEVIQAYEKASILRNDSYYDARFNLGVVYNEVNNAEAAVENLLKAYELKPTDAQSPYLLAQCYAKLNKNKEVEHWLQKGLELKEPEASDYYQIGTSYGKIGHNLPKAIQYIEKAVALDPTKELYYEDLAVAHGINGQYDKAIKVSKKLVELNPQYAPAYQNLAISYRNKGDKKMEEYYRNLYEQVVAGNSK